jgi:ribosomal protein S18 acetylase RimI-like enzyme
MKIRKYKTQDSAKLIELWQQIFPGDPPHNEPLSVLDAKLAVDDLIFVAESEDEIVGACMAGYDGHRGWLYAVAVNPNDRRGGLGKQLVTAAIEAMQELGCIKVNLQIRADNTAVAEFYKALGFSVEERMSMGVLLT